MADKPAAKPATTASVASKSVAIVDSDGSVSEIAGHDLAEAQREGARIATPDEVAKARGQAKYGGALGTAEAFGAGALRGATLGLSDAVLSAGPDEADQYASGPSQNSMRAQLAGLRDANPMASTAGEVAGVIAPLVLSEGALAPEVAEGLTLRGAVRGLGALPRAVGSLGEASAASFGEGLVGGAVRGGVEGSLYGAGSAVSEAALGDHELTAEQLLAGAKGGAISGALLGGGGGLLGKAFTRAGAPARDIETVAARELGDATPGLGESVKRASALDDVAATYIQQAADNPEQAKLLGDAWRRRAEVFGAHDDTLENATRKVVGDLDTALKAERAVDMEAFGGAKEGQMARLVDASKWREARDAALSAWQESKNVVDELMADPTRGGSGVAVNRASKFLEKFGKEIGEVATAKDKGEVAQKLFAQLDDFKRAVGQNAMFGKGPFGLPEAAREFDALYHHLQGVLENEDVWGKAALAQREVNAATHARLSTRATFGSQFTTQYGSEAGRPLYVASPEGASSYVRNLTSAKNDLKHRALQDYIANEEKFLDTVEKHYTFPPEKRVQVAEARKAFQSLRSTLDSTSKEVTTVNQLKRLQQAEQAGGMGGLVGLAADVGTRPLKTLERLALIEQHTRRIDDTIRKGVRVVFGKGERPPPVHTEPLGEEFARVSKQVTAITADPTATAVAAQNATTSIADHAPRTSAHVATVASRAATFLATKLPAGRVNPDSLTPQLEQPRVSDTEKDRFLRYARAANNPVSVVHDLAAGRVSREGVETLRTVYPRLYEKTKSELTQHLAAAKEPLTYQQERQIRIFLGMPAARNADLLRELEKAIPQNDAEEKGGAPAAASPLKVSTDVRTLSEKVEGH